MSKTTVTIGNKPGWKRPTLLITVDNGDTVLIVISKEKFDKLKSAGVPVQG